ncbi:MAG TPA: type II CAAX endopeptidase family protein [Chondromyces sp.]|jgi:membrane protease YdiL (CAAX protease family)|nr:type II CAAX endopeptidase family protein [Chondromyces sp.]
MDNKEVSKAKRIFIFVSTIILGFVLFVIPNLFFGISKVNGGLSGVNLLAIAVFQFITVCTLIYFSLKTLGKDFLYIGLSAKKWKRDFIIGLFAALALVTLQFGIIIPNTGGAERPDVKEVVQQLDGTAFGLMSLIFLGVVGGGITEEIYNRGYFINVLKGVFNNQSTGLWVASVLSILFFAAGHLPSNSIEWIDILISTITFTLLFLLTKRLTASIVAHGVWNMTAIILVNYLY